MALPILNRLKFSALALLAAVVSLPLAAGEVRNTGSFNYQLNGNGPVIQVPSNELLLTTVPNPSPAVVRFNAFTPGGSNAVATPSDGAQCFSGGAFSAAPAVTEREGAAISTASPALTPTTAFRAGDPVFITLQDDNRNADPLVREIIEVRITTSTGDEERMRLQETGVNTGLFAGALQTVVMPPAAMPMDCRLSVTNNSSVSVGYTDAFYPTDTSTANILVDPFGIIFNTSNGAPVSGATVSLLRCPDNTGIGCVPATVFCDDGATICPNTQVTGGPTNDPTNPGSQLPPGGFRFPLVEPGFYRVEVTPLPGFVIPSTLDPVTVQALRDPDGNPFSVIVPGSFGGVFQVINEIVNVDVPADSTTATLLLDKAASRTEVSAGDFLQYTISVRNTVNAAATNVVLTDTLPVGLRYQKGSARRDGQALADPVMSADGRTLAFAFGAVNANGSGVLAYVAEVSVGARQGLAVNTVVGTADGGLTTNRAQVPVRIKEPFFGNCGILVGRVVEGECGTDWENLKGVPNVRILLEDGTYTSTDEDGLYHFEKVCDGTHVVQLDLDSLPRSHEAIPCIQNTRFAGRSFSQFVDLQGGSLWRADFYTHRKPPLQAPVGIRLLSQRTPQIATQSVQVAGPRSYAVQARFDTRKANINAEVAAELDRIVASAAPHGVARIEVFGHTDNVRIAPEHRREFADNQALSEARAHAAASYLARALSLPESAARSRGFGDSRPLASNRSASGRALNRRVEVTIYPLDQSRPQAAATGYQDFSFRLELDGGAVPVSKLRPMVMLPEGVVYQTGSAKLDGKATSDPAMESNVLSFSLGDVGTQWKHVIEFSGKVVEAVPVSAPVPVAATVSARFDSRRAAMTPALQAEVASLAARFKDQPIERLEVIGHTDNIRIAPENRHEFADNEALSAARAATVAQALAQALGLNPQQVHSKGRGEREPKASNSTAEGRAINRRVEVVITPAALQSQKATRLCSEGAYQIRASALFDAPEKAGQRLPMVENRLDCGTPAANNQLTYRPKFATRSDVLQAEDRAMIQRMAQQLKGQSVDRIEVVGHTDNVRIAPENRHEFADNYALSEARARAVGLELAAAIGLGQDKVSAVGRGPDQPVADNRSAEGRQQNRRVEVNVGLSATPQAAAVDDSQRKEMQVTGPVETLSVASGSAQERVSALRKAIPDDPTAAGAKTNWMTNAQPGVEWLFPSASDNPRAPATRIVIKHLPDQKAVLIQDGEEVGPLAYDGTDTNAAKTVAISLWRGLRLREGANRFSVRLLDGSGKTVQTLDRVVHFSSTPSRAELVPDQSVLVADGVTKPVVAVRFFDRDGQPVHAGVVGDYQLNAPFVSQQQIDFQQTRQLAGEEGFKTTYRVESDDGVAFIELQPTTQSGALVLNFNFQNERQVRNQELRTWMEAVSRNWILVGFAEGTVGYDTLKGNAASLAAEGRDDEDVYTDGQMSFYAKGQMLGKWLLTLAYDTDKERKDLRRNSLLQTIDPNEFYTLYGDGTQQRYDAASQEKLYLKLERDQFYALFGDYETGLTQTQLSRYSRTINGLKTEYIGDRIQFTVFAADTPQNYARDEIQGNGTSGLYRLSRGRLVLNGERITLQTRDRFKSEQIVASRALQRHVDYDIDYSNGTLFFREAIQPRDISFNPQFILAEYEVLTGGEEELSAGGRVALNFLGGKVQTGLSYIRDEQNLGESDLGGLDAKIRLAGDTEIRLEVAASDGDQAQVSRQGEAYLAELEHHGGRWDGLVYTRRQDSGFGLQQQGIAESATEKHGLQGSLKISDAIRIGAEAYRQENLTTEASRDVAALRADWTSESTLLRAGLQSVRDESIAGQELKSDLLSLGAQRSFFGNRLELLAQGDAALGDAESVDFPARYLLQAGYAITPETRLTLVQEITDGEAFDTHTTRLGASAAPWAGAKLSSTLNQSFGEFGPRTFAQYGLSQNFLLGERWSWSVSLDQSHTFNKAVTPAIVINPAQPIGSGGFLGGLSTPTQTLTDDFFAVSTGLTYRAEDWSWTGRAEHRDGEVDDRSGLVTSFLRQARKGVAFAASAAAFQTDRITGAEGLQSNLDLSWAYRPLGRRWSLLDRLTFRYDTAKGGSGLPGAGLFGFNSLNTASNVRSRALVNNLSINRVSKAWTTKDREGNLFDLNQRNQWSFYYGAKYTLDNYDGEEYSGYTDMIGAEWRYDLRTWLDVGAQASILHSWKSDSYRYSFGPMVGVSPLENTWATLGYNVIGFRDQDFEQAKYTAQGPYLKLRVKFDQTSRFGWENKDHPQARDADEYRKAAAPAAEVKTP